MEAGLILRILATYMLYWWKWCHLNWTRSWMLKWVFCWWKWCFPWV